MSGSLTVFHPSPRTLLKIYWIPQRNYFLPWSLNCPWQQRIYIIYLHYIVREQTKPANQQSRNRCPKRPFRMDYAKMTIFILLAFSSLHYTDSRCTPQDCQVSSWTYWSPCLWWAMRWTRSPKSNKMARNRPKLSVEDQNVRFWGKHGRAAVNSQGGTVSSAPGHIGVPDQLLVVFLVLNPAAGTK